MPQRLRRVLLFSVLCSFLFTWSLLPDEKSHDHEGNSDEYFYLSYAKHISRTGICGFSDIIKWYNQSEKNRYHPSPLRAGYILLTVLFLNLYGPYFSSLVILSYLCFLISCLIFYYYAKKNFSEKIAVFFIFLYSVSPLTLGMSRVALSESVINLLMGTSVWLFLDFLQRPLRKTLCVLTGVLFISLLVKETSVLFIIFIVIFSWIANKKFSIKIAHKDILILVLIPPLLTIIFYLLLLGTKTFNIAIQSIYMTHFIDTANQYAMSFSSGPWYRYLVDFMLLSPVMTTLSIGYGFHLIIQKTNDWKKIYFLIYALTIFIPLSLLKHTKVVRFVINLEMVSVFFCALAVNELFKKEIIEEKLLKVTIFLFIIWLFYLNQFNQIFASSFLLDPTTYNLMCIKEFIPHFF